MLLLLAALPWSCDAGGGAGTTRELPVRAALEQLRSEAPPLFLDVRTPAEYEKGHIPGALNVPHDEIEARLEEVRAEASSGIVLFCERGGRTRVAAAALARAGLGPLYHLEGDMRSWRRLSLPLVRGSARGELASD